MKVKVTISIEKEIFERAQKIGLNISRVAENALVNLISTIEKKRFKNNRTQSS
ncbi:MAG: type II toxin-antitoxin system CcdA family antitoxin [Hadesarchaea archaeon]|nr:type II toxin-antitoxin system CcdA family antitoxin [Hadesarchaea archaeon]